MKARRGFTLVEILIVVVILGILAAIVIPQFTEASNEARFSSLCSDLQMLRSQIELYKAQHNDQPPPAGRFIQLMTVESDQYHVVPPAAGQKVLGPYMQKVPVNPFNQLADAVGNGTIDETLTPCGGEASWDYNPATGEIFADDAFDDDGDGIADHLNL